MLIVKFAICIYMIVVITMATGCSLNSNPAKHGDASETPSSAGNDNPVTLNGVTGTADLTGAPENTFEIFSYSGVDGEWRGGAATFLIPIEGPGTFVILSSGIESRSCSSDQFHATFALFDVNADGSLAGMRPLEAQLPLKFYEKKMLHLQVDATVKAHCTSIGPAKFFVSMKFISQKLGDDATDPGPNQPGQIDPTGPTDPADEPHPQIPLPHPVPRSSCKDIPLPANAPDVFKAKIRLWTEVNQAEGCKNTFTWSVRDAVRPDPYANCVFPDVLVERPQDQFLKISESFSSHKLQLAWLLLQSNHDAAFLQEKITKGLTIDLTYEDDPCTKTAGSNDVPAHLTLVTTPTDFLLFRNDAREREEEHACSNVVLQALQPVLKADQTKDLKISYRYTTNQPDDFFYALDFNFSKPNVPEGGTWSMSFFNRRSHSWITAWQQSSLEPFNNQIKIVDDDALHHLLPNQKDLELVFRHSSQCTDDIPLTQAVFDVGDLFTSAEGDSYVNDLTNPGRSRFLLRATDLP